MKLITFAVPCYNSQDYMRRCIDTLLTGGEKVEIIIVNDGSKDRTGEIADEYAAKYPTIVKAVHQENQGHGQGVNVGLAHATGEFYKVVDSDDWLDTEALKEVLERMEKWQINQTPVDMLVCNYIYDHLYEGRQQQIHYRNVFESGSLCNWHEIGRFLPTQYLIMHALIFKTEVLRKSGVQLPKHTFYVDNIFAYQPLPFVENIFYLDVDLYHYFIGREDQSVNEKMLMKRIDQQILVTKLVSACTDLHQVREKKLATYMTRNISVMMAISSIHLLLIGDADAMEKRRELWEYMRQMDKGLYKTLRYKRLSGLTYLPGKLGDFATLTRYRLARKLVKFQ